MSVEIRREVQRYGLGLPSILKAFISMGLIEKGNGEDPTTIALQPKNS